MDSNKFLKKYIDLYLNLGEKNLPEENYEKFQDVIGDFISNFPEIDMGISNTDETTQNLDLETIVMLNYETVYRYLLSQPFLLQYIPDILNMINKSSILQKAKEIQLHLNQIINVIQPQSTKNFKEKKRIYLGVLWFLIGYYICYMIHQIENLQSFPNLLDASQNNLIIFLTCCFIFYDDILDLDNISKPDKKWCLSFTDYFFQSILDKNNSQKHLKMLEIESNFFQKTKINTDNKKLRDRTLRLLEVCLTEKNKVLEIKDTNNLETESYLLERKVRLIYELFQTEVRISKTQKNILTRKEMLENLLTKSQKSIEVILTCLVPQVEYSENVMNLTYKFSLVSQLLDDLNDIEDDILEGNMTIFQDTHTINYQLEIETTLKYLFYIRDYLQTIDFPKNGKMIKDINHMANMLVFNYAVGKNVKLKLDTKIEKFKYIRDTDIIKFRVRKMEFQKNLGNFSFK